MVTTISSSGFGALAEEVVLIVIWSSGLGWPGVNVVVGIELSSGCVEVEIPLVMDGIVVSEVDPGEGCDVVEIDGSGLLLVVLESDVTAVVIAVAFAGVVSCLTYNMDLESRTCDLGPISGTVFASG